MAPDRNLAKKKNLTSQKTKILKSPKNYFFEKKIIRSKWPKMKKKMKKNDHIFFQFSSRFSQFRKKSKFFQKVKLVWRRFQV